MKGGAYVKRVYKSDPGALPVTQFVPRIPIISNRVGKKSGGNKWK
jgi:hypothetical protein